MGADTLCLILIGKCGRETDRIAVDGWTARDSLPLRRVACEGLARDAAAVVILRSAADHRCIPCADEMRAVDTARRALRPIGLRLHDYILWHGDRCVSLRLTGRL